MKGKYKMTGCARFFLVMLILIPLAYVAASFITGDDGLKFIKSIFGSSEDNIEQVETDNNKTTVPAATLDFTKELERKNKTIDSLERENMRLKARIHDLQMGE